MVNFILAATVCFGALLTLQAVGACGGFGRRGGCGGGGFRGGCGGGGRRGGCGGHHSPCGHSFGSGGCGGHGHAGFGFNFGGRSHGNGGHGSGGHSGKFGFGFKFGGRGSGGRSSGGRSSGGRSSGERGFGFGLNIGGGNRGHPGFGLNIGGGNRGRPGFGGDVRFHGGNRRPHVCPLGGIIKGAGNLISGLFGHWNKGPCGNAGLVNVHIPHIPHILPQRLPPIKGSQGPFSWETTYYGDVSWIIFRVRVFVDGQWRVTKREYKFPGGGLATILRMLKTFKTDIKYKPEQVQKKSIEGGLDGFNWKTTWRNSRGKITFYYRVIKNGKFVVRAKTYTIYDQGQDNIDNLLIRFQHDINFKEPVEDKSNGEHFNFRIDNGQIVFFYKYRKNGHLLSSVSKTYDFSGDINVALAKYWSEFRKYCLTVKAEADKTTEVHKPKKTGNIKWHTETRDDGNNYFVATYEWYEDGEFKGSLSKDYEMTKNTEEETKELIARFKSDLQDGKIK